MKISIEQLRRIIKEELETSPVEYEANAEGEEDEEDQIDIGKEFSELRTRVDELETDVKGLKRTARTHRARLRGQEEEIA